MGCDLMSRFHNIANYRAALAAAHGQPAVPFIAPFLSDLTMLDENPNTVGTPPKINFAKFRMISTAVGKVLQHQPFAYNLESVLLIQEMVLFSEILNEDKAYDLSLEREPRAAGNDSERDQHHHHHHGWSGTIRGIGTLRSTRDASHVPASSVFAEDSSSSSSPSSARSTK